MAAQAQAAMDETKHNLYTACGDDLDKVRLGGGSFAAATGDLLMGGAQRKGGQQVRAALAVITMRRSAQGSDSPASSPSVMATTSSIARRTASSSASRGKEDSGWVAHSVRRRSERSRAPLGRPPTGCRGGPLDAGVASSLSIGVSGWLLAFAETLGRRV